MYEWDHLKNDEITPFFMAAERIGLGIKGRGDEVIEQIASHLAHARSAHPDWGGNGLFWAEGILENEIREIEEEIQAKAKADMSCDKAGSIEHLAHLRYECYDAIAVLIRMINGEYK